ncbi:unnamed protein product [marine sediment metagenome]|uniref:Uncharacterized protein n=1 Tax=marine sediment metagenome TaxID=412755 RepID=X1HFM9_9ZZZZ
MIENSCFVCHYFKWNRCRIYEYYFKDHVAKVSSCDRYTEREQ